MFADSLFDYFFSRVFYEYNFIFFCHVMSGNFCCCWMRDWLSGVNIYFLLWCEIYCIQSFWEKYQSPIGFSQRFKHMLIFFTMRKDIIFIILHYIYTLFKDICCVRFAMMSYYNSPFILNNFSFLIVIDSVAKHKEKNVRFQWLIYIYCFLWLNILSILYLSGNGLGFLYHLAK